MLVLARKERERICIGESIVLTVVHVRNGQVRLAFEAPDDVVIDREEVRKRRGFLALPHELCSKGAEEDDGGG